MITYILYVILFDYHRTKGVVNTRLILYSYYMYTFCTVNIVIFIKKCINMQLVNLTSREIKMAAS